MKNLGEILVEPKNIIERLLQIILWPILLCLSFGIFAFFVFYVVFGLWILDGIYYILTGKTIIYKYLKDL